ncbi:hypothetical protein HYV79_00190 [Candidatus Woesearchaeota archaeon]|nr:hypothetical protein [Candidatus Woesearchaeota archaeon]
MPNKKSVLKTDDPRKTGVRPEKNEFLDPEEHEESKEEFKQKIETGERDEDVYTEEGREQLLEDDDIADWEQGFSEGSEETGELTKCASCGKVLSQNKDEIIETETHGELHWYCSDKCARKGEKKHAQ